MNIARLDTTEKRIFTTLEAAEICRISHDTIIRCFDSGKLRGFWDRRAGRCVDRKDLERFMRLCGYR